MSESYLEVELDQQPIELCKLLKIADLVGGGGEAKIVISEGYVLLNGEVEYQKRKKVYHNDVVEFNGEIIQVIVNEDLEAESNQNSSDTDTKTKTNKPTKEQYSQTNENLSKSKKQKVKNEKAVPTNEGTAKKNKRKPISF